MKNLLSPLFLIVILLGGGYFLLSENSQQPTSTESAQTAIGYQGKILAGSSAPFLEFSKADYEKTLSEGKIIFLNFYANWCPICRGEEPAILEGFNSLTTDKIIGFRVNFNDSDTDSDEKSLAKEFNIPYQHTKVILKNGQEFSRSLDSWTKETFDTEIAKALQ